ncbi:twin-arginine translocase TatA/TatE family subunit [Anaeromyxobacter oryzisoli]|uniref:twin-arginine translocase TatA/TatE family subunit n=1 Tax=Anaeromyxobacter oryzisoli TaxID=2925408 RepID=UPI001F591756|nr:twin-arginine translocase TatA/TatE family subunit [Anaeromyxobacter sp. SG63]
MPRLGMPELIVILLIVVVLFGASKLPQLGAGLGQGIRSFKKALSEGADEDKAADASKPTPTDTGSKQA